MITFDELCRICSAFNEYGVKYVVIGGCAVILHGLERTTADIDLLVDDSMENIKRVKGALRLFLREDELQALNANILKKYKVVRVGLEEFYIDLLAKVGAVTYNVAKEEMFFERVLDIDIPTAGLNTMIALKQGLREIDKKDKLFLLGKKDFLERKR